MAQALIPKLPKGTYLGKIDITEHGSCDKAGLSLTQPSADCVPQSKSIGHKCSDKRVFPQKFLRRSLYETQTTIFLGLNRMDLCEAWVIWPCLTTNIEV